MHVTQGVCVYMLSFKELHRVCRLKGFHLVFSTALRWLGFADSLGAPGLFFTSAIVMALCGATTDRLAFGLAGKPWIGFGRTLTRATML